MDLDEARAKARLLFPKVSPPADCPLTEYGRREVETKGIRFGAHIGTMTPPGFPLPELLYFGLTKLLDLEDLGTEEKVLWTVHFSIDGATYAFSYRKFGLRFLIEPHNLDTALTKAVLGKARALTDIVEKHLATSVAFQQLDVGLFTIESL